MKFKIVLLAICTLLLSGCTATYELNIKENTFTETVKINNMNLTDDIKQVYLTNPMPVDYRETCYLDYDRLVKPNEIEKEPGINYYNIKESDNGLIATADIQLKNYKYSRPLNYAFVNMNVNNYDNYISIYGFDGPAIFNMYNNLDSFEVIISTDKEVTDQNADKVIDGKYYWTFTREDEDKELYIEMDSTKIANEKKKKEMDKLQSLVIISILIGISIIAFISFLVINFKHKRNNKI